MKRLYLLRHAKSGWTDPEQDDYERTLSPRGRRAAPLMGRYMQNLGYAPSIALCSPAQRTRETWAYIDAALECETVEDLQPELYLPEPRTLFNTIREIDDTHSSAIVISHNPGILTLALGLLGKGIRSANPFGKYPTAALAVFDFDIDSWAVLQVGRGTLIGYTRPKELDSTA